MNITEFFENGSEFATFRPTGSCSLKEAIHAVSQAITLARDRQIRKLLVDVSGLEGFQSPTITARYWFMREWAEIAGGKVQFAMVAKAEMIDPQKFGITVATNAGLLCEVFASETEAIAWLNGVKESKS